MLENLKSIGEPGPMSERLRDADVDAVAEVARQVDSELWLNSTDELCRWSVEKKRPRRQMGREIQNESSSTSSLSSRHGRREDASCSCAAFGESFRMHITLDELITHGLANLRHA